MQDALGGDGGGRQPGGGDGEGHPFGLGVRFGPRRATGNGPLGRSRLRWPRFGHVDAQRQGRSVGRLARQAVEPGGRPARDERARLEPAERFTPAPHGRQEVGECAIRGDDDADQEERRERDRGADLPEERGRRLRQRAAQVAAGDAVVDVVASQPEKREDHDDDADDRQDRLPADEPEPELEGDARERQWHQEGRPAQQVEQDRPPPHQDRSLIGGERHRGEDRERDDRDRPHLVTDAGLDRGRGSSTRAARRPSCHTPPLSLRPA